MKNNIVGWFEIPVEDMDRAVAFYEQVFNITLLRRPMGDLDMAWFPWEEHGLGAPGSLVRHIEFYRPSAEGILIYMSSQSGDVADELSRVEAAGGRILRGKTHIAEGIGWMGLIIDSEGNRIALHSKD